MYRLDRSSGGLGYASRHARHVLCSRRVKSIVRYRCLNKNTPPEKKVCGQISFRSIQPGAGEQFLLKGCRARARRKGQLFSQTTVCHRVCVYIYIYIYIYMCMYVCVYIYIYIHTYASAQDLPLRESRGDHQGGLRSLLWLCLCLSELHKDVHMTTGHWLFCREFLCFNTMPRRHMPLLVHFWDSMRGKWIERFVQYRALCAYAGTHHIHTFVHTLTCAYPWSYHTYM